MASLDDQAQTRLALAGLFAALAQTLAEESATFDQRFREKIERIYLQISERGIEGDLAALECLGWTRELLKK